MEFLGVFGEFLEQDFPDPPLLPATEPLVDGVPVTELFGEIPSGTPDPRDVENRLHEIPIDQFRWCS